MMPNDKSACACARTTGYNAGLVYHSADLCVAEVDLRRWALNVADCRAARAERDELEDCGASGGENACGECLACLAVRHVDTTKRAAAAEESAAHLRKRVSALEEDLRPLANLCPTCLGHPEGYPPGPPCPPLRPGTPYPIVATFNYIRALRDAARTALAPVSEKCPECGDASDGPDPLCSDCGGTGRCPEPGAGGGGA